MSKSYFLTVLGLICFFEGLPYLAVPDQLKIWLRKVIAMDTFIVNLADPGANRYLRVTMDVEVTGGKTPEEEINRRTSQLRDAILMILPTKKFSDIVSTEGKTALRDELIGALNTLLTTSKVSRIYFKEFVIQ